MKELMEWLISNGAMISVIFFLSVIVVLAVFVYRKYEKDKGEATRSSKKGRK